MQVKKQQLEPYMEQLTGSNLRKEYDKAVNCYPVYLTWTSSEIPGWMGYKLESRLSGEISTTSDIQMIPTLMAEREEELKSLLMRVKEESENASLKLNIKKTCGPITS